MGSVDDGTSVGDSDDEEHKHHFSIDTHVLHADHDGKHLNILDAPGTPDFIGAAIEALAAVETAAVVVCAVNGIQVNTRRMFHEAGKLGLARVVIINKLDSDAVGFAGLVANIRGAFGKNCVLFNMPNNTGANFTHVIDVLHKPTGVPTTHPYDQREARTQLMEAVVEVDEALMEKYLTDGSITDAELEA